jgi:chorismate dehydratase
LLADSPQAKPRVCAVSYLNTVPLVWGMLHSPDLELRQAFDLRFEVPSVCADQLASGEADIGIVPVIEMARQGLDYYRGTGIACHGAVRSILLVSKVPFRKVRKLATDSGSRTSVMLSRVILGERFGASPAVVSRPPVLEAMLAEADAALLIGDAALGVDPATLPFETLDLGTEWMALTGLPFVFAVWAGRTEAVQPKWERYFLDSCRYGLSHIEEMVRAEAPVRRFSEELIRRYFTRHIVYELGERDYEGMRLYLQKARALDRTAVGFAGKAEPSAKPAGGTNV